MQKQEILIRPVTSRLELQEILKAWASRNDADVTRMGRLVRHYKTEGESMHWHIRGQRKGMGTVEVIYLPSNGKLAVLVHDNRRGSWAGQAYKSLVREIGERTK